MQIGTKVKFTGTSDEQVSWGDNGDPRGILNEKDEYTIDSIEVHTFHTKVGLKEFPGKRFNSCGFDW